jgi:hypothetical protein
MLTKVSRCQRGTRDLWNLLITTPIHTNKLTGKANSKGSPQDILFLFY